MFNNVIPDDIKPAFPNPITGNGVRPKLLEILGLENLPDPEDVNFTVVDSGTEPEGIIWSAVTYLNSLGESVPGIIMLPEGKTSTALPGIVCVPGTGGSAEEVADQRFEPTPPNGEVLGFGRELARRGYAVMAISIKGCYGRPSLPGRSESPC